MKTIIASFFTFLYIFSLSASHYYLSSSDPLASDNNTGLSPSLPWKTITKLNTHVYQANDTIFFKCGDIFRGNILVSQGGTAAAPIVFTSYGTGAKPIISGAEPITNWAIVTNQNYYASSYTGTVNNFFVNGKEQTLARFPNEHSYLSLDSAQVNYLKDASLSAITLAMGIGGAKVCVHSSQWSWEKSIVASYAANKITYSTPMIKALNNYGYFLADKMAFLDTTSEWIYDATGHYLYYYPPIGVNPNNQNCEISVYQNGIEFAANVSYINLNNLAFTQQANAGISLAYNTNRHFTINNCYFSGQYKYGISLKGRYCHISNCYFREVDGMATYIYGNGAGASTVDNCTFVNNGVTRLSGIGGQLNGTALMCAADSNYFHHNTIDSTGYCGISADGAYNLVERNKINHAMLIENDGAAIKGWGAGTHHSIYRNNFIENSDGNTEGTYQASFITPAIYFDFNVNNCTIANNTVYHHNKKGIFQNSSNFNHTITGNVLHGGNILLDFNGSSLAPNPVPITGMTVKHNSFFSKDFNSVIIRQVDYSNTYNTGILDSNYYFQPYNANRYALRMNGMTPNYYSFVNWQATGNDAHTKSSFVSWTAPTSNDTLIMNQTDTIVTVNLGTNGYLDLDSNLVCGAISLQPYTAKILINTHTLCTTAISSNGETDKISLSLYPNPASDFLVIQSNNLIEKVEILNSLGELLYVSDIIDTPINIQGFARGLYFVRCTSKDKLLIAQKWIKE